MKNYTKPAAIPNPALEPFEIFIGEWDTVGTHPYAPGTTFHGHSSFTWLEGGAFMIWYSEIYEGGIPAGMAIFGSDDAVGEFFMLYFDERKVSRKMDVSIDGKELKWWRNATDISQRFTWVISDDGNTIVTKGEMSKENGAWEKDLELTFHRKGR
jgi:hypothetical protein